MRETASECERRAISIRIGALLFVCFFLCVSGARRTTCVPVRDAAGISGRRRVTSRRRHYFRSIFRRYICEAEIWPIVFCFMSLDGKVEERFAIVVVSAV